METDEPDVGAKQDPPASNVVRFPRGWIGPLEELVPFGPSAGQPSDEDAGRAAEERIVDLAKSEPVRPDDFWGEDSAAIHHPLQPEAREGDAEEAGPRFAKGPAVDRELRRAWLRRARRQSAGRLRRPLAAIPRRMGYRSSPLTTVERRRRVPIGAIVAAAAAVACAALAVVALHHESPKRAANPPRAVHFGPFAAIPGVITAMGELRHAVPVRHSALPQAAPKPRPHSAAAHDTTYVRASASATPSQRARVIVYAPASGRSASSGTTEAPTSSHVPSAQPPAPTTSSRRSVTTTTSGRPAFGANGLLGPGSSPDS